MADNLKSKTSLLKEYFGLHPDQKLQDFAIEVRALSEDDKLELARGAAKNIGYTQDQVDFPLAD